MYLTLEESTTEQIPAVLDDIVKSILSKYKPCDSIQKDFLFVLILVLMMENGFYPKTDDTGVITREKNIDVELISKWKSPTGLIETILIMDGFENITLKLVMSPLGATALINIVISDLNLETYSVCLPVSRYVVSPQASTIPMIFRDLKHLSVTFKNKVLSAVKSRILSYCGYPSASMLGLPEEVFFKIILYLPVYDVLKLSKTCKKMKLLVSNESLWHNLYRRDFSNELHSDVSDWKKMYEEAYVRQQQEASLRRAGRSGTIHDLMEYSDMMSYVDNPMWDMII